MLLNQVFCLYWEVLFLILIRNQQVPLGTTMHPDSRLMVMVVEEEEEKEEEEEEVMVIIGGLIQA